MGGVLAVSVLCGWGPSRGWGPSCECCVGGVLAVCVVWVGSQLGVLCGWTPSCVVWVGS